MKVLIKPILAIIGFVWVIAVIFLGLYYVQKRQTTDTEADSSFCVQQGYIPLNVGEVCPAGTEETTINIASNNGTTSQSPDGAVTDTTPNEIRCCKQNIVSPTESPSNLTPVESGSSESALSSSSSGSTTEPIAVSPDTPSSNQDTAACPALPQLSVNVTCSNCLDRAQ